MLQNSVSVLKLQRINTVWQETTVITVSSYNHTLCGQTRRALSMQGLR